MTLTQPSVAHLDEANAAVIRDTIHLGQLRDFYDAAFREVLNVLAQQGVDPTGPALGVTWGTPGETVDVACGFPTASPIAAAGRVTPLVLPGGPAAVAVHVGGYDSLGDSYRRLAAWIADQGLAPGALAWEAYETRPSPDADPAALRTGLTWPLATASERAGVVLTGQLLCRTADEAAAVLAHLPGHVALTRAEPGCLRFDVVRTEDPLVWQVDERFDGPESFRLHQDRVAASEWGRATAGIERRYTVDGL